MFGPVTNIVWSSERWISSWSECPVKSEKSSWSLPCCCFKKKLNTNYFLPGAVKTVAISADSKLFASGSYDKTARIWRTRDAECMHVLEGMFLAHLQCEPEFLQADFFRHPAVTLSLRPVNIMLCLHLLRDHWSLTETWRIPLVFSYLCKIL